MKTISKILFYLVPPVICFFSGFKSLQVYIEIEAIYAEFPRAEFLHDDSRLGLILAITFFAFTLIWLILIVLSVRFRKVENIINVCNALFTILPFGFALFYAIMVLGLIGDAPPEDRDRIWWQTIYVANSIFIASWAYASWNWFMLIKHIMLKRHVE